MYMYLYICIYVYVYIYIYISYYNMTVCNLILKDPLAHFTTIGSPGPSGL